MYIEEQLYLVVKKCDMINKYKSTMQNSLYLLALFLQQQQTKK